MRSRIRSFRRRKRLKKEAFDKKLIVLRKELLAIRRRDRELGYEELSPPVQRGWKRVFVLRDELTRGKDAKFLEGILEKINTTKYSWRKDFKKKRRHNYRRKIGHRQDLTLFKVLEILTKKTSSTNEKKSSQSASSNLKGESNGS